VLTKATETVSRSGVNNSNPYVDVNTVDAPAASTHPDGSQSTHPEAKARDALDALANDIDSGGNQSSLRDGSHSTHQEAKARDALDALATDIDSGGNQSTLRDVDLNSIDGPVPGDRVLREPTLAEKARAVVDEKTGEVLAKIHETSQTVQHEINEATQGLQKELNPDSHELARHSSEIRGAVTQHQVVGVLDGRTVTDIGWHKDPRTIPDPLIGGYTNGQVFTYIRRFNKVRKVPASRKISLLTGFYSLYSTFAQCLWRLRAALTSTKHGRRTT
jgi:hypothetical protein